MPKSRRDGARAEISRPAWYIRPSFWISSPAMARSKVVLPHPDGPRKHTNSPSSTSSVTFRNATISPNRLVTLAMRRYGSFTAGTVPFARLFLLRQ